MTMAGQVLIMVAPNGARLGKEDHPALPMTAQELAAEACACQRAGAAAVHLHVRDAAGRHSLDATLYRDALRAMRAEVGREMVLQITTEAAGIHDIMQQMQVVRDVRPEGVSLALREFLPEDADDTQQRQVADFLAWMAEVGIAPQFILYEPAEVARLARLVEQGVVPWRRPFPLFVLGRHDGTPATPGMLDGFLQAYESFDSDAEWMACAFGPRQIEVLTEVARQGGHVRVGFENGREIAPGRLAADNAALVRALVQRLEDCGLRPMAASSARVLMNLQC